MNDENVGVIYILTNPSFPQFVKIDYAGDIEKRLKNTWLNFLTRCFNKIYFRIPNDALVIGSSERQNSVKDGSQFSPNFSTSILFFAFSILSE